MSPPYDHAELTSLAASGMVYELLCLMSKSRQLATSIPVLQKASLRGSGKQARGRHTSAVEQTGDKHKAKKKVAAGVSSRKS